MEKGRSSKLVWVAAAVTALIAICSMTGILFLRNRSDRSRQGQLTLSQIRGASSQQTLQTMSLLGLGLASGGNAHTAVQLRRAKVQSDLVQLRRGTTRDFGRLRELGFQGAQLDETESRITALIEAMTEVLTMVEAQDYDDAYIYGLRRIEPASVRVHAAVAIATEGYGEQAERDAFEADFGTIAMVVLGLVLMVALERRISRERKGFQDQLQHEALHDPLTDLPNRRLFKDRVDVACKQRRKGHSSGVLFIDLDGFKEINDSLGHDAGDLVLCGVGERLRSCLRDGDTVARMGGDEFAVLLSDVATPLEAMGLADRVLGALSKPFDIYGTPAAVGASLGIALLGKEKESAEELCGRADNAMYLAKRAGKGAYRIAPPKSDAFNTDAVHLHSVAV